MKQVILLMAFCAGTLCSTAQSYIPIPDTLAVWTQVASYGMMPAYITKEQVFTAEKVLIDSFIYTVLRKTGYTNYSSYSNKWAGMFRNDTTARKVYFKDSVSSPEYLMYDFSLHQGDSFVTQLEGMTWNNIIDTIIEVEMFGATYRKYIFSDHGNWIPGSHGSYIEGVGSLLGFGWPIAITYEPAEAYLECFSYDNNAYLFAPWQWYAPPMPSDSSCKMYNGLIAEEPVHAIRANYQSNENCMTVEIQNSDMNNYRLIMYDVSGRQVMTTSLYREANKVYTQHLQKGIYVWIVYIDDRPVMKGKMVNY